MAGSGRNSGACEPTRARRRRRRGGANRKPKGRNTLTLVEETAPITAEPLRLRPGATSCVARKAAKKEKAFRLSRDDDACAEALLTPRSSPRASNLRIGRKLVWPACKLPSNCFNKFAAAAPAHGG